MNTAEPINTPNPMSTWKLTWTAAKHEGRYFWLGGVAFLGFFVAPAMLGWVIGRAFTALEQGEPQRLYW
ncbi:MAG: hypothetical protein GY939_25135, partial [Actinomycetia bacterium]|nr:hypothetical protein [Actinomycetes bacterium]